MSVQYVKVTVSQTRCIPHIGIIYDLDKLPIMFFLHRVHIGYYASAKRTKFLLSVIYMGHLDNIQTALKPLKKLEKMKIYFYE